MKQLTDANNKPCCRMGWFGAAVTAAALIAVLVSAVTLLSPAVLAGSPEQGDDLAPGPFSIVEPPLAANRPAPAVFGEAGPEALLANWNYTDGGGRPKISPGH
jgi:hypothetical protein